MRLDKDIPLIIPEINPNELELIDVQKKRKNWDGYIVKNPNCTATILALSLAPLIQHKINTIYVSTMQSISGAGKFDISTLDIKENIIPYIKNEEEKIELEIKKIFDNINKKSSQYNNFNIYSSCHRVPVIDGHLESVYITFNNNNINKEKIKNSFLMYEPIIDNLPSSPSKLILLSDNVDRPQPKLDAYNGNGMSITIGRIRDGIRFEVLGNNTIRGGAGGSILNAELLYSKHLI